MWKFTNGTSVAADTFEDALEELGTIKTSQFWASETCEGKWDVQLSDNVIVYDVAATSVMEAVRYARWKVHLDTSFKSIAC